MNLDFAMHGKNLYKHYRKGGVNGLKEFFAKIYLRKFTNVEGKSIYESDWDLLIILDACRVDLLESVKAKYDFLCDCNTVTSFASQTKEWMEKNFTEEFSSEMKDTIYVCGNPFSAKVLRQSDFFLLDEVWRYGWNQRLGTIPPRPLTDKAIERGREYHSKRIIVHYMQPHVPFIGANETGNATLEDIGKTDLDNSWDRLRKGDLKMEEFWESYRQNLEYVLGELELLFNNIEAERAVISSDHGNAMGEFNIYAHPSGVSLETVREVPWCKTCAVDRYSYIPEQQDWSDSDVDIKQRLIDLGYID